MKYFVNRDPALATERAVEQWVLRWCEKYHPEAWEEARKFVAALSQPKGKKKDAQTK
tara:strand:+ start:177 stop:347 length:171 start_codon:yes stop_codon:yes gene_type:complete